MRNGRANWSLLMFFMSVVLISTFNFEFTRDWLRDSVPFLYFFIALLIARLEINQTSIENSTRALLFALKAHAIWYGFFSTFDLSYAFPLVPGSQNAHFFEVRGDYDPMLAFVYLAWIIIAISQKWKLAKSDLLVSLIALVGLMQNNSRAATLSFLVMILATLVFSKRFVSISLSFLSVGLIAGSLMYFFEVPLPGAISKLPFSTALLSNSQSEELRVLGDGTSRSRVDSWAILLNYSTSDVKRLFVGVGPGQDFMSETGAGRSLIANFYDLENAPRSPHNIFLTVLLRFGIIGLILYFSLLVGSWQRLRFKLKEIRFNSGKDSLNYIIVLLFIGIVVTSSLGVVVESPFGAIPLAWVIGLSIGLKNSASKVT